MAFQIVDDVLDLTGTDEVVGKPTGRGPAAGVYTLPVIRALRESEVLHGLLGRPLDEETVERAGAIILSGDAIATSRSTAEIYVRKAIEALTAHRQALDERVLKGLLPAPAAPEQVNAETIICPKPTKFCRKDRRNACY